MAVEDELIASGGRYRIRTEDERARAFRSAAAS